MISPIGFTNINGCGDCKNGDPPILLIKQEDSENFYIFFECCGKLFQALVTNISQVDMMFKSKLKD